jgi:hypothetical protein
VNDWKVLGPDRKPCHHGTGQWPEPGEWLSVEGEIEPCKNGLHLCRREDLVHWLGPEIWEVEADESEMVSQSDKVVVRRARLVRRLETWNDKSARLFACDCAERVVHLIDDPRPRAAIDVGRRFAVGDATRTELDAASAAARDAARAAARAAAWDAARDAAWGAAWSADRDAAGAAAWGAAWSADRDAAGAVERAWQTERLFEYLYPAEAAGEGT